MGMRSFSWERFLKLPVVGILRGIPIEDVIEILPLYRQAGFTTVEVTLNTPDAEAIIHYAVKEYGETLNVGAGTICNIDDFERAQAAGSQFIVTPVLDENVITACGRERIPIFPGAYTPSEIYKAWSLGATMVKVFPASTLGPSYFRELRGPLKQIKVLPTGGITLENCMDFLDAGVSGLGIGSQLFDEKIIRDKNWNELNVRFGTFAEKIKTRKTL